MDRHLLRSGFVLVLLALLTGLAVPQFTNPRLGLAAHTVGIFGGLFLVVLGIVTPALALSARALALLRWCWIYAAWANWAASVLGALSGASRLTPLAGAGTTGTPRAEFAVAALLLSLAVAAIGGTGIIVWGLRDARSS